MIDRLRTLSARLVTRYLHQPKGLVTRAWFWLARQSRDPVEKRRRPDAALDASAATGNTAGGLGKQLR
jgi:hypothetical protein